MSGIRQGTSLWLCLAALLTFSTTFCTGQNPNGNCVWNTLFKYNHVSCQRIKNFTFSTKLYDIQDSIQTLTINHSPSLTLRKEDFQHPALASLESLILLDINMTTFDPDLLINLQNLQQLRIHRSNMTSINAGSLTGVFCLTNLELRENGLRDIGDDTFRPLVNLRNLDLSLNYLKTFTYAMIGDLPKLNSIDLGYNLLTNIGDQVFKGLSNLQSINLEYNNLATIDPNAFQNNALLSFVVLRGNTLWNIDEELFLNSPEIKTLDLSNMGVSEDINNFPLRHLNKLQKLVLSGNNIPAIPVDYFSHVPNLQFLELSHNKINSIEIGTLSNNLKLKIVDLLWNNLTSVSVATFSSEFYRLINLEFDNSGNLHNETKYDSFDDFFQDEGYYRIYLSKNNWDCNTSDMLALRGWLQQRQHDFNKVFNC